MLQGSSSGLAKLTVAVQAVQVSRSAGAERVLLFSQRAKSRQNRLGSVSVEGFSVASIEKGLTTALMGRKILYYRSIGSTNDVARELAAQGAPEGTLVIADEQTAGKGRRGRRWLAPPATSLLMSLLFRPRFLAPYQAQRLTMICSLAVIEAIEAVTGLSAAIKWPNDIVVQGKKAGGILTELGGTGQRLDFAVVGLGLNVNLDFGAVQAMEELAATATSLSQELGREVSRLALLWRVLENVEGRYQRLGAGELPHDEWASRLVTLDHHVMVDTPQGVVEGWAEGVDADGALILRANCGERRRVLAGDVTLRKR
jgi:BirA family biotin operon repressor/biotin-[acetyl-CoA-carboxylase] ligase